MPRWVTNSINLTPADIHALAICAAKSWAGHDTVNTVKEQGGLAILSKTDKDEFERVSQEYGGEAAWEKAKRDGKTRLDYRQWVQVRTSAFKRWFGDWENETENDRPSTGVDRRTAEINAGSGRNVRRAWRLDPDTREPRRFYHGTTDVFTQFDTTHPNRKDAGWLGRGVYVSSDRRIAEAYSNIKIGGGNPTVMTLFVNVRNPYVATLEDKKIMARASQKQVDEITQRMIAMGRF